MAAFMAGEHRGKSRQVRQWGALGVAAALAAGLSVSPAHAAQYAVLESIEVGGQPEFITVNSDGTRAYVSNSDDNTVSIIDLTSNTVVGAPVTVGPSPYGIALTPDGNFAYVANSGPVGAGGDSVSVIDLATTTVKTGAGYPISVDEDPYSIAINPAGTYAYVTNREDVTVSVIDLSTDTVTTPVTVGVEPYGVAINRAGTFAYVVNAGGESNVGADTVSVIDLATNTLKTGAGYPISVGDRPWALAINPAGTLAYVVNNTDNTVSVIDLATDTVSGSPIAVGDNPWAIAIGPNGRFGYVPNYDDGTVSILDLTTNTVTENITVGGGPSWVDVNPAGTRLYVTRYDADSVAVIDLTIPSEDNPGPPGIYLYIAGTPGRLVEGTPVYHGSFAIASNSTYRLSVESRGSRALTKTVLSTGVTNGGGHVEQRIELGALAPGAYKIVMMGYHELGYPLVLTNHISVDGGGKLMSVSAESLQPTLR